ncbi:unnamed protein product [Rotaria socialis]
MDEEVLSSFSSSSSSSYPSPPITSLTFTSSKFNDLSSTTPIVGSTNSSRHSDQSFTSHLAPHSTKSSGFIVSPESSTLSYDYPRNCYLTTEAKINDIPGIVLLDTGLGVTIISSSHWKMISSNGSIAPYNGPEIQRPDGSSIGPEGRVLVQITLAGLTIDHPAILARNFRHLILLGNDFMKSIGIVLDLQDNKMWLRSDPNRRYSISSDLTQAGRIDVPVISTERRIIAPYHVAYIQVSTPPFLSHNTWDASITGHRPHIATANSLIRFRDRKSFVQIINCSSHRQKFNVGQPVAVADLYFDDTNNEAHFNLCSTSSMTWESPMPIKKEGKSLTTSSFTPSMPDSRNTLNNSTGSLNFLSSCVNSSRTYQQTVSSSLHFPIPISSQTSSILFQPSTSSIFSTSVSSSNSEFLRDLKINDTDLNSEQVVQLENLLLQYRACFNEKPGRTSLTQHHVDTGNSNPIKLRPYRVSPVRQNTISSQIQQMLTDGIIEPANGPYAAPVTLQPKKDGYLRFCVDFHQLNSVTVRDVYSIPRIDDTLDHHAFRINQCISNIPALMDLVLGGLKWSCALVYLDDIIVYSPTFSSHLQHLESVLQQIQESGLTLHLSKCQFCKTRLRYLGHIVSQTGIEPDPEKIRAVRDYPVPTRLKEVRTFLGLTNNKRFQWTSLCQQAFDHLRHLLIEPPIIAYPQFDKTFILQHDASDFGLSAILAQKLVDDDGVQREHVIGYASRTLTSSERKFSPTERECLAIVYGCSHFRPYLEGVRFTILTDHKALKWLHQTKDLNSRLARWTMQIAAYDVDIQHRPGADNTNCDALSRAPIDDLSISNDSTVVQESSSSSTVVDPGYLLVLDYFYHCSLPPSQFPIPISLHRTTNSSSPTSSHSIFCANIHFGDNIQLYEDIRNAQWNDAELRPLINYLQTQQLPDDTESSKFHKRVSCHRLVDGALYRVLHSSQSNVEDNSSTTICSTTPLFRSHEQLHLVIPKSKIFDLLSLAHDHPTAAHLGHRKTLYRLSSRFYWSHMRHDVEAYVRACELCQKFKASNKKPGGLMRPIVESEPWNTIGIDLTGPLPKTRRGNTYILVVIDYFTKWVELFALANTKAKTIAQLFVDEVLCRFGFPVRVISDNGVQFISNIFVNVCQVLDIKHQRTPLYHPQSNLCERVNRTLKLLLAALAYNDNKSWDLKLPQIAFALRTAPSDSIEQMPAFLMFGRHPRQPLDLCLPSPVSVDQFPTATDLSDYRKRLLADLLPAYVTTRELLDISHQKQATQYNQHHRPLQFEPDDLVWVTALSGLAMGKWRGNKLSPRREGPYRVVERLSSLTYSLIHTIKSQQFSPIHINRLERYYSFSSID